MDAGSVAVARVDTEASVDRSVARSAGALVVRRGRQKVLAAIAGGGVLSIAGGGILTIVVSLSGYPLPPKTSMAYGNGAASAIASTADRTAPPDPAVPDLPQGTLADPSPAVAPERTADPRVPVRPEGITAVTDRQDPARATDTHAAPAATRAPDWPGRFDVYRDGAFVSQKDPTWCTAAASQMMMSLASGHLESSTRRQAEYYAYGYQQRAYAFSEPGLDPAAWVAILDHFGRLRYRVVAAGSVDEALKTAARQMRVTGRPVGLVVGRHGDHSWVMTGFTATADPARTDVYTVTGIWTLGPNWPKQAYYRRAFDSPPHTYFSIKDMRWIMDRYADKLGPTMWDGRFVAVVPEA